MVVLGSCVVLGWVPGTCRVAIGVRSWVRAAFGYGSVVVQHSMVGPSLRNVLCTSVRAGTCR